ncbi:histidine phosphatase family protein [Pilimelia columellifera]|uniref:Histidine phosphatase family protein n=1 Tax=Pilimelia columellifera subsp. columellifera TaxID=706583 RepID=A0ABP6B163_9ACTN
MQLTVVRHGQTAANQARRFPSSAAVALDGAGWQQACRAGQAIAELPDRPQSIHSSDSRRALDTADLIERYLRPSTVISHPELREIDWGTLADGHPSTRPDINPALAAWQRDPTQRLPGGESLLDVDVRVSRFLDRLAASGDDSVVVVSHAVTIGVLVAQLNGWDLLDTWHSHRAHLRNGELLCLDLAPITASSSRSF